MKKNYLLLTFLICICFEGISQEDENFKEKKNAIAISFGSPGLGLEYARKLSPKLSGKIVWQTFSLNDYEQKGIEIKDDVVDLNADLNVSIVDLGIEYTPFKNSSFKLTTGLGFLSNVNVNSVVTYTEDIVVGTVIVDKKDVGEIIADVTWSGVAPYIGVGFGRAIPKKRFGFGIEFGTYFASAPNVDLTASNLLAPTASQEENLQESLESFKFIPRIQIRLAYKF